MHKTERTVQTAMGAALLCISAWISFPFGAASFSMQIFAVFFLALLWGALRAELSLLLYLILGAFGLPVFAGMQGGVAVFLSAQGGFLLGFLAVPPLLALLRCTVHAPLVRRLVASASALTAVYALGVLCFVRLYGAADGLLPVLCVTVLPYLVPDAVKLFLAFRLAKRLSFLRERKRIL